MEIRITCTVPDVGTVENVERVQDSFDKLYPDVGAVTEVNLGEASLGVTFSIECELQEFAEEAAGIISAAWARTDLPFEGIEVDISLPSAALKLERELQPA